MKLTLFHSLIYNKENLDGLLKNLPGLKSKGFNAIIAEVATSVRLKCHPEICDGDIDIDDLAEFAQACKSLGLQFIPLINFLGHQGWKENRNGLLKAYPQFEEVVYGECNLAEVFLNYTPAWCPQTEVLNVIRDVIGEVIDKTKCKYFHIGMDEVFKIGLCKKCKNYSKGELFVSTANNLNKIVRNCGAKTMMWGDRLIPNSLAGSDWAGDALGIHEHIDNLSKDIIICDWQYNVPYKNKTNQYLLEHGFSVVPSVWNDSYTAYKTFLNAVKLNVDYKNKVLGIMLTNWSLSQSQVKQILDDEKISEDEQLLLKNSINVFSYFNSKN